MILGGYQIVNLAGKDVETGVNVPQVIGCKKPLLISGLQIQDVILPDFWFNGTTEDGELYTQNNLYLSYYISINYTTGAVQVATTG